MHQIEPFENLDSSGLHSIWTIVPPATVGGHRADTSTRCSENRRADTRSALRMPVFIRGGVAMRPNHSGAIVECLNRCREIWQVFYQN